MGDAKNTLGLADSFTIFPNSDKPTCGKKDLNHGDTEKILKRTP
jgi:hypothetical protein